RIGLRSDRHEALLAASMKRFTLSWSLIPGDDSSLELASTPQGCATRIASATLEASKPPATITLDAALRAWVQSNPTPLAGPSKSIASTFSADQAVRPTRTARQMRETAGVSLP